MNFVKNYDKSLDETVLSATHESGLKVVILKKKGFSKKYATFSTKYGSINTKFVVPGEEEVTSVIDGIAHFLEHKVFEQPDGTNAFNEFSKYGASANAFTSFGITNYLFSCTEHFYENLSILLDFVQTPYFTDENVEKEKGIIAQEIKMYEDDAEQKLFYNCLEAMYKNHPVKTNIAGSVEEINKTTPELLYKCYNTFYHPSNMALICVGDIDENSVAELVDKYIKKDAQKTQITQIFPKEDKDVNKKYIEAEFDIPVPMFSLGIKDCMVGKTGEEMLKREILTTALILVLFGRSSAFYEKLYNEGDINHTFSAFYEYEESCAYAIFTGESENIKKVEEKIYETLENAAKNGIDKEAFERTKKVMLGKFYTMLDSVEGFGDEYVFSYHRGIDLLKYPELCESASVEEANARVKELFRKEACSMSVILPKKK